MGFQQIIMILLSVIIIGASITISIVMFDKQSDNSVRQIISSEIQHYSVAAQGFWRTVRMTGGAGGELKEEDTPRIAKYIDTNAIDNNITTQNGKYEIKIIDISKGNIEIRAESISNPEIKLRAKVNLANMPYDTGLEAITIDMFWDGNE
ncbi:MAG: hypothetical protein PHY08_04325 [Candidatus Cloacimonetes bacterium]|jgi:hypothetical protein|nr:hypothetical protein [Candidatus Cloacimonadota bacterium]MDD4155780.1 hypothetical protein [Candidatus Cloacimonadota bacterium]